MVIIQFEDDRLLAELPALCAVPGVDACMIGPRDLSLAMGFPDGPQHPEVQAVIDQAIALMHKANVAAGMTAGTRADAERQVERGAKMILAASQWLWLAAAKEFLPVEERLRD